MRVVSDEVAEIARAVRELAARHEALFTSGGVGPTHDDLTLLGIARAFDEPLVRSEPLAGEIRRFYGERVNDEVLRMADLPRSATLVRDERLLIPLVLVKNVWVLPGEPTVFAKKLVPLVERFRRDPFHVRRVYTSLDEGVLAAPLRALAAEGGVQVGSYPRYDTREYAVMITLEAKDAARVEAALEALVSQLPEGAVLRVE